MSAQTRWMGAACAGGSLVVVVLLLLARKPWELVAEFGPPDKPREFVAVYGWWAAALNAALLAVLAFASPLWARAAPAAREPWLRRVGTPRWFWPAVCFALAVLALQAMPRMTQSLWDDEENSVRRLIVGRAVVEEDGSLRFKPARWEQAIWNYERPTNHHLQTALAKLCHEAWQLGGKHPGPPFREWVVRLPSLLAGLGSVVVLAVVLLRLGFPRAGAVGALLLAMHPWFVRYGSEARGYSLTIFCSLVALWCALGGIESGRWRWWLGYAVAVVGMLLAYPPMVVLTVLLSVTVPVAIWLRERTAFHAPLARWFVASTLAAMAFLQVMIPCRPQVGEHVQAVMGMGLTPRWQRNLGAFFLSGTPWNNSDDPAAGFPELRWRAEQHPWSFRAVVWATLLALVAGLARLLWRRGGVLFALPWLVAPVLLVLLSLAAGLYVYEWYLIFALPCLLACVALGLDAAGLAASRVARGLGWGLLVAAIVAVFLLLAPVRGRLLAAPLQGMKDAALAMRGTLDAESPGTAAPVTGQVATRLDLYDPRVLHLRTLDELASAAESAEATGREFLVTAGNPWAVSSQSPEVDAALRKAFDVEVVFRGFDPTLDQRVLRAKPGAAQLIREQAVERKAETPP